MAGNEIFHVAAIATNVLAPEVIAKASAITGQDHYQTRLLLTGMLPRLIAHYTNVQDAETTAQDLTGLGLIAFVCSNFNLRRPQKLFTACAVKFLDGEASFRNSGGGTRNVKCADVFLMLKGIWRIPDQEETTETKKKINWGATLLTGGIPIFSSTTEKTGNATLRDELFLRIYTRESPDPAVQMSQSSMSYSFLGSSTAPSSAANFNTVVTKLQAWFPDAVFDDRLGKIPRSDISSARDSDAFKINCKLLYLYFRTIKGLAAQNG
jgi:hypothetical protein